MRAVPPVFYLQACVFALIWQLVIALLPRSAELPWVSIIYAALAVFFPIIVAMSMGYNEGWRAGAATQKEQNRDRLEANLTGSTSTTERDERITTQPR
jgi:hypothetical protein